MSFSALWRPVALALLTLVVARAALAQSMVVDTLRAEWTLGGATAASMPPPYPVIFVHGLNSNDLTWRATIQQLQSEGWGEPFSYHADLNASTSTYFVPDVPMLLPAPFWQFANPRPGADSTISVPTYARPAGTTTSRLFVANFENVYDAATQLLYVHSRRNLSGQSESNCSAVVKQAYALSGIIENVLGSTGADRVILMGHSMGGLAIREYLQRRRPDGSPMWWVAPNDAVSGHRVAGVVTTGTPHQGSNTVNFGIFACPDSEATRDLRYTYLSTGEVGRYLYGGSETIQAYWDNNDVNADGDVLDVVDGINMGDPRNIYSGDNPQLPLPRNVRYSYIYSNSDGIVDPNRQYPVTVGSDGTVFYAPYGMALGYRRDRAHLDQTSDVDVIRAVLLSTSTVADEERPTGTPAFAVSAYPNPTRGPVTVSFTIDRGARVGVSVVDLLGRVVLTSPEFQHTGGTQEASIDASGLPPGLYMLTATVDGAAQPGQRLTVFR